MARDHLFAQHETHFHRSRRDALRSPRHRHAHLVVKEQRAPHVEFLDLQFRLLCAADAVNVKRDTQLGAILRDFVERPAAGVVTAVGHGDDRRGQVAAARKTLGNRIGQRGARFLGLQLLGKVSSGNRLPRRLLVNHS